MDSPATTGEIPANALPWLEAVVNWSAETVVAVCLFGDWDRVQAAWDDVLLEQDRFMAARIAASSGAATELDYYGSEA